MKPDVDSRKARVSIRTIRRTDAGRITALHDEFEDYLRAIDPKRTRDSSGAFRRKFLRDGFGSRRAFTGFVATEEGATLGYVLYHPGYDPDEMGGRILYVVDLYVTDGARGRGIGRQLMQKVADECRKKRMIDVYFAVWTKNPDAEAFYLKIGATHNPELRFYHFRKLALAGTETSSARKGDRAGPKRLGIGRARSPHRGAL